MRKIFDSIRLLIYTAALSAFFGIALSLLLGLLLPSFKLSQARIIILCVAIFAVLFTMVVLSRRREARQIKAAADEERKAKAKRRREQAAKDITYPPSIDGAALKYQYKGVAFKPSKEILPEDYLASKLTLRLNSEGKVKLYADKTYIGTLPEGVPASVSREWINKKRPYLAYLISADDEMYTAAAFFAFYKDEYSPLLVAQPNAPAFKLMGTRGEDEQLAARFVHRGDAVTIDLDAAANRYAVYDVGGNRLGYLPAKAAALFEENGEELSAFIHEVSVSPTDTYELRVIFFD